MRLLPSEQRAASEKAIESLKDEQMTINEPCDCGSQIRHNNGGNYHTTVEFRRDSGQLFRRTFSTSEYDLGSEWESVTEEVAAEEVSKLASLGWYVS